ncbi:MAG: hypothetical protein HY360_10345 [Verrucomicrobia bacterium]|nr:hypothetical protein [Verrucomicrobiota bacterium]
MKNITLSVEDDVYQAARVEAAKRQTSLSAVVRGYLRLFARGQAPVLTDDGKDEERTNREELVRLFRKANLVLGYKPSREKTYER